MLKYSPYTIKNNTAKKKSHTFEEGGGHLRISF